MRRCLLLTAIAALAAVPLGATPHGQAHIPLPADLSGTLNGSSYAIRVPANWNGTLLVWCHGSGSGALQVVPPTYGEGDPDMAEELLSRGYAVAGSYYPDTHPEAELRTLALTNFFKGQVGTPTRVIVWGNSLGGQTTLDLVERYSSAFDGAIAVAPVAAGMANWADEVLRYDVAYAAVFGWPSEVWGDLADIRDDLEVSDVMPNFAWGGTPGQWEFVRLMMKMSPESWWQTDPGIGVPGFAIFGWKATVLRSESEREYGGPVGRNAGQVYTLTADEKAYLAGLGVAADPLLEWMNAHANIEARHSARVKASQLQFGTPTGKLGSPTITMHGIHDPLLPVWHEAYYRDLVAAAGRSDELVQAYVDGPVHAGFTAAQYLAALEALEHWLDTGERPDASYFPAAQGFLNGFVPPPWPY